MADPVVAFRETVGETSAFKCHSEVGFITFFLHLISFYGFVS